MPVGDECHDVLHHCIDGVVELGAPLGVSVAALVECEDVVAVGEVKADEVPRMRRLIASVE